LAWIDVTTLLAFFMAGSPLVKVVFRRDQHYRIRTSRLISSVPLGPLTDTYHECRWLPVRGGLTLRVRLILENWQLA
jgi:hypothetical protein